ncbi:sugar diacid utilization regulator [Desulfitobacterium dehalogenans ATCC 51507]|uniref:Sugar diacid utilization regulator n=1 Tax=Desulfitobacterium dehalogenans (strain ATCC 51507 / DSM 9161 / JW/IU-DC1) TaxID=756499 RepID=I4A8H5_DESDJ|nr:helix-turn-helix domain-containing protein [Desulfitobacterium dehalogenans]AFM00260.1 sugar diacid utilization regulator [Desulfitobacterium dehalogenans ATCC 51507]
MNKQFSVPDYMQELVMASGQGLDLLTHTLAKVINRPVLVSTSAYKLVASSSHYDCEFFQVELDDPRIHDESLFLCHISAGTFKVRAIGRAIAPLGRVIGYIFILSDEDNPDREAFQPLLDYTSSLYAVHLQSRLELKQEQSKFKNAFLYDLLYGNLKRSEDIIATGEVWGWNFSRPHTVMVFLLPDPEHHNPGHHLMDFLSRIIEEIFIDNYYKNPALILRQNELVILVPLQADKSALQKEEILGFAEKTFSQIRTTELNNLVTCGVGQVYSESTELFRSYQEAKVAFEMGKLLEIPVPFFSELGLERILYKHDLQDLKEYYVHVLGELHKQDDPESSLIALLESFAENQFDVNKTAKAIFMHPNTLRYRLNKIENILGKSLTDNHTRLDIMAALKIKRLHTIEKLLA